MLPENAIAMAVEMDGLDLPDPNKDAFEPSILGRLLDDRHERILRGMGLSREARRLQASKWSIARKWLRILEDRKHDIQMERCAQREPYPDLLGYELRFRARMLELRILLLLHFAGIRGLDARCQRLIRPLLATVRPLAPVIAFPSPPPGDA